MILDKQVESSSLERTTYPVLSIHLLPTVLYLGLGPFENSLFHDNMYNYGVHVRLLDSVG